MMGMHDIILLDSIFTEIEKGTFIIHFQETYKYQGSA